MASVNKVIIVGNLGADPETRFLPSGDAVCNIRVATTDKWKDKASGDTMLSRYFRDMATHRVLRPEEEVEAAKKVEELERQYWVALFAYPAALETVALVVDHAVVAHEQVVPAELADLRKLAASVVNQKLPKKAQERWDTLSWELACRLRELDGDRLYVEGSYVAVERIAGRYATDRDLIGGEVQLTPAFRRYVERVLQADEGCDFDFLVGCRGAGVPSHSH